MKHPKSKSIQSNCQTTRITLYVFGLRAPPNSRSPFPSAASFEPNFLRRCEGQIERERGRHKGRLDPTQRCARLRATLIRFGSWAGPKSSDGARQRASASGDPKLTSRRERDVVKGNAVAATASCQNFSYSSYCTAVEGREGPTGYRG